MKRIITATATGILTIGCMTALAADDKAAQKGMNHSKMQHGEMNEDRAGEADAQFLDKMSAHHVSAIDMAKLATEKARSPAIKKMAKKVIKNQSQEIEQMKKWRERKFASVPKASDLPAKMDMSKLERSEGADFDVAFADMMAKHHDDGRSMIKSVENDLKDKDVKAFAQKAAKNQSKEIDQLNQIKSSIKN